MIARSYAGLPIQYIDNDIANDHKRHIVELFVVIFYFHITRMSMLKRLK